MEQLHQLGQPVLGGEGELSPLDQEPFVGQALAAQIAGEGGAARGQAPFEFLEAQAQFAVHVAQCGHEFPYRAGKFLGERGERLSSWILGLIRMRWHASHWSMWIMNMTSDTSTPPRWTCRS
ncbi:hypothetical protein [Streptomyces sp. RTd22]|uniref:hypothetical protein n=1 Tax=Streptomyces sp. RTd22 TaxID=1841249 RepID=UPI001F214742|nr:hypothetical protein [Streptomyces sp. RTd22]